MRRIFSHPIAALFAGAALRLLFVLRLPTESGDAVIYEQLARNWAKLGKYAMTIAGQAVPVDLRMPGYPGFLAGHAFVLRTAVARVQGGELDGDARAFIDPTTVGGFAD